MASLALMGGSMGARALETHGDDPMDSRSISDEVSLAAASVRSIDGTGGLRPRRPLSSEDAALIRQVISLQRRRSFVEADRLMEGVQSDLLRGTILAQRLKLTPNVGRADLAAWLERYGTEAGAADIRRLLAEQDGAGLPPPQAVTDVLVPRRSAARMLFAANRDFDAMRLAMSSKGARGPGDFAAGLAAWRSNRRKDAGVFFSRAANDPKLDGGTLSAALFWLARVRLHEHDVAGALVQLRRAAAIPGSFYGLLAQRLLADGGYAVRPGSLLTESDLDVVESLPAGKRALALLQVGYGDWAIAELRHFLAEPSGEQASPAILRSFAVLARDLERFSWAAAGASGSSNTVALSLPGPARGKARIDTALLYALIRVESNFKPDVVSRRGARGLMQIMPNTAAYLFNGPGKTSPGIRYDDPATNIEVGQRYVLYLSRHEAIRGNLLRLLGTYNIGVGGFAKMEKSMRGVDDPLLFIEAIPKTETREFVQRVLAFSWLYSSELVRDRPSLDALALGEYPYLDASGSVH